MNQTAQQGEESKFNFSFRLPASEFCNLMRLLLLIIVSLVLAGCSNIKRGDILDVRDLPSPDGRYVCTVFGETFHDTTGYARHIYLRRAGEGRGYPGNVYIVPVGSDVTVSWTSSTNLSVRLKFETRREVPAVTNVAGVTVTFSEAMPAQNP